MEIDLNADLGESFGRWRLGDDESMVAVVTSANVACGFHAGDPVTLVRTCRAAVGRGVVIGAQVGYRDLAGFGRRFIDMPADELSADILYQLGGLEAIVETLGTQVRYLKPHGALYNAIVHDREQAQAVVDAVLAHGLSRPDGPLPILGLPGSVVLQLAAANGVRTVHEAFADRAYNPDGTLVPRRADGAVLHDPAQVADRVLRLVTTGTLDAIDGSELVINADSVCVHGDSPGAVDMAIAVRDTLTEAGVRLRPFCEQP